MEKEVDIVALGELLIDFTENGISPQGNPLLEANPGADVFLPKASRRAVAGFS